MALALNNLKSVDMPLNKETKPNQTKPNHPVDAEPMEVLFDTFDVPITRKDSKAKIQLRPRGKDGIQRESTLTRKRKDIHSVLSESKKRDVIYPTSER